MKMLCKIVSIVSVAILVIVSPLQLAHAWDTTVSLTITPGVITIEQPGALTFATSLTASFNSQTLQQAFTWVSNYFIVQDLKGTDSGYNTTLQMSWDLVAWSSAISGSAVLFRAAWTINVISWSTNPRVVLDAWTSAFQSLNSSRSFIRRNTAANSWVIGRYGANIEMRVDVPAWQAAGSYVGTVVYTLIEN